MLRPWPRAMAFSMPEQTTGCAGLGKKTSHEDRVLRRRGEVVRDVVIDVFIDLAAQGGRSCAAGMSFAGCAGELTGRSLADHAHTRPGAEHETPGSGRVSSHDPH